TNEFEFRGSRFGRRFDAPFLPDLCARRGVLDWSVARQSMGERAGVTRPLFVGKPTKEVHSVPSLADVSGEQEQIQQSVGRVGVAVAVLFDSSTGDDSCAF